MSAACAAAAPPNNIAPAALAAKICFRITMRAVPHAATSFLTAISKAERTRRNRGAAEARSPASPSLSFIAQPIAPQTEVAKAIAARPFSLLLHTESKTRRKLP